MKNENTLHSISAWFKTATPKPTDKDICVQLGCHFEEVSEMITSIAGEDETGIADLAGELKQATPEHIKQMNFIQNIDKVALLDALCDQIVTAVGVAELMGMDIHGALDEVNRSNYSKFENGKAVRDEFGKIARGKDYFEADLERFV